MGILLAEWNGPAVLVSVGLGLCVVLMAIGWWLSVRAQAQEPADDANDPVPSYRHCDCGSLGFVVNSKRDADGVTTREYECRSCRKRWRAVFRPLSAYKPRED